MVDPSARRRPSKPASTTPSAPRRIRQSTAQRTLTAARRTIVVTFDRGHRRPGQRPGTRPGRATARRRRSGGFKQEAAETAAKKKGGSAAEERRLSRRGGSPQIGRGRDGQDGHDLTRLASHLPPKAAPKPPPLPPSETSTSGLSPSAVLSWGPQIGGRRSRRSCGPQTGEAVAGREERRLRREETDHCPEARQRSSAANRSGEPSR